MSSSLPTSGQVSFGEIREYIGLIDKVHLSAATTPFSLRQIFFSPRDTTNLNTYAYLAASSLRGCRFAAYTNYTRSSLAGGSLANKIDGDITLYLGLSNPSQNSGYGQSGLLYTRNRGLPIKLDIQATSGNLKFLYLDTYSNTTNTYNTYWCGSQGGSRFIVTNNIHQLRLYTDIDSSSEFIIRIIPMLDGKNEGRGEHPIMISLIYFNPDPSSSSFPEFEEPLR